MIPLLVATSGRVTVAPLTVTASPTPKESVLPLTAVADPHSSTAEDGTSLPTTWYSKMSASAALPSSLSSAARSMPASAKA